jgi:hypothetical protein
MTIYYMQDALYNTKQPSKVTAFQPVSTIFEKLLTVICPNQINLQGFRMFIGNVMARSLDEAARFRQLTYTCLETMATRDHETIALPKKICPAGIMTSLRFPNCWDGKNLDSPDHLAHM